MFDDALVEAANQVIDAAVRSGTMITTAESCTGGLIGAVLTAVPGSSAAIYGGTITYANPAKMALGVPEEMLIAHGAVSEPVARAMAQAAHAVAAAAGPRRISVAVTGVAGPGGGSAEKPVGLVHFAAADGARTLHREMRFGEIGRDEVRRASVLVALELLATTLSAGTPALHEAAAADGCGPGDES